MSPIVLQDPYSTPSQKVGLFSRAMPSASFYLRMSMIVCSAARRAKAGRYTDADWMLSSQDIFDTIEGAGIRVNIENHSVFGRLKGPAVVIGNHMSTAETFMLAGIIGPYAPLTFVVKRSLVTYPIFGHVMRSRDPVVVNRDNPREDFKTVMEEGAMRLQRGLNLVIFPQRTRTVVFSREEFNSIGVKLARAAGVPVIPLALYTEAWGNGRRLKDFGPIRPELPMYYSFGEPLSVEGNGKAANEAVMDFIEQKLAGWQAGRAR